MYESIFCSAIFMSECMQNVMSISQCVCVCSGILWYISKDGEKYVISRE